jgi:CubicO group peptidase (beta-lactamase class C family)
MHLSTPLIIAMVLSLAGVPGHGAQAETPTVSRSDLTGVTPLPLTGERRAAFEAYIADALYRFDVPGAAVAVVQNGEVVYLNGFGVTEVGSTRPVTPDTMMMVGSITKSMTTMMAGALIDDGRLTWDTRLVDLLPEFAVGDPALTNRLTVRDAFCNCSGVPGLNIESYFERAPRTPETVVTALADVTPTAGYGEQYIYNNLLVSSGGYALGVANGGASGNLGLAYDVALRERILGPIGMTHSTFDPEAVLAGGDYALPHAIDLSGDVRPMPLSAERVLLPFRPAGALWSNARDMARYLQTELAHGVAPGGTRVVSVENLEATWTPTVSVSNYQASPPQAAATRTSYGLGWLDGEYRGHRVVSHAGGTGGFAAEIAFLPEADVGIVILTNALALAPIPLAFEYAVELRLFELLFDQPAEFDAQVMAQAEALAASRPPTSLGTVEPAAIAPYLGRYDSAELGEVSLSLRGDRLVLDAGELNSELRPLADGSAETSYALYDPPLSLFSEAYGATVSFTGGARAPRMTITLPASVTGPEQQFVFSLQ